MAILVLIFPLSVFAAEPEPACKKQCLQDGYYATACSSVCVADPALGPEFNIARKQYQCMHECQGAKQKTLINCIFDCKEMVRTEVTGIKEEKMNKTIEQVEKIYDVKEIEVEKRIEDRVTSKPIEVKERNYYGNPIQFDDTGVYHVGN